MTAVDSVLRWWRNSEHSTSVQADTPDPQPTVTKLEPAWLARLDAAQIPRTLRYPATTLGRILDQTADRFGDSPAIVYQNERFDYRQLLLRVNRLAAGLASLGVEKGDKVLLTLPNCPEYVVSFFAIQKLGAVVVNAGPLVGPDDLTHIISITRPRAAIGLDLQAKSLDRIGRGSSIEHFVWVSLQMYQTVFKRLGYQFKLWQERERKHGAAQHHTLAALLERAPARPPTIVSDPGDTAVLQPTGGTTGTPKLAELSHRNLLANAMQICVWSNNRTGQETVLTVLPMFHVYGLTTCLICGVFSASRLVLLTRFGAEEALETLRRERATLFPLVPAICDALSNQIEKEEQRHGFDGLRICISGAAPLPIAVAERFERLTGAKVIEGYGLSEASPVTHANLPADCRHGTIGLPMPDTQCRIVNPDQPDHEMPVGESGELLVSGPQIMRGYYGDAEQTSRVLTVDADGKTWLHTGDLAVMQPDGFFVIVDRRKDMIIRSGLKIFPGRVEKVLQSHPSVTEAAVVGRADIVHTQTVLAYIVSKVPPEHHDALVHELRTLCREHLAPYEVPAEFRFIDMLPRSALGKVLKKDLLVEPAVEFNGTGNGNGNGHGRKISSEPQQVPEAEEESWSI